MQVAEEEVEVQEAEVQEEQQESPSACPSCYSWASYPTQNT